MGPPLGASLPKRICCFMVRVPRGSNRIQGCGASFAPNWRALLGCQKPLFMLVVDRLDRRKPIQALTEIPQRGADPPPFRLTPPAGGLSGHLAGARS